MDTLRGESSLWTSRSVAEPIVVASGTQRVCFETRAIGSATVIRFACSRLVIGCNRWFNIRMKNRRSSSLETAA